MGELHVPVLLLNKADFKSTITIHNKRWHCIDITPVVRMPIGLLVVRMTYCNSNNFKIYAYKTYDLTGDVWQGGIEAIKALAGYEFYRLTTSAAICCPVNYPAIPALY